MPVTPSWAAAEGAAGERLQRRREEGNRGVFACCWLNASLPPDLRSLAGWQAVVLTHLLWRGAATRGAAAGAAERMAARDAACWRASRREAIVGWLSGVKS